VNFISKVLIVQGAYGEAYEPAWLRALQENGIDVRMFSAHEHTLTGLAGRIERRVLWGPGIYRLHSRLLNFVKEYKPDVTLLYQGHYYDNAFIKRLRELTFVTGYHNDDPFGPQQHMLRYRHLKRAISSYDGFHIYRTINVADIHKLGQKNASLLMPYFLPWVDFPRLDAKSNERWQCDVVYAGHAENDYRGTCISLAVRAGHTVRVYGEGRYWNLILPDDVLKELPLIAPIFGDGYRYALSGAKIAACFFSKVNRDVYTRRSFEIPACGTFLLSERTDEMRQIYREGVEADYFSSPEEFISKVEYYLRMDAVRERIAAAGYHRVTTGGHDVYSRMHQWLADVNRWRNINNQWSEL
jgi:spore maturation protein CgeB